MDSNISDRFTSERVLHKLKETLQAQSALFGSDLSIQMSCMQAATSTLLEVKNILDGLSRTALKNVADILASTDAHFVFQRFLIKCYYFLESNKNTADILQEGIRPSGVLIFCPLYIAVTEVLTPLLVSLTFAGNIASTKIFQLLLKDLNVLVLPNSEPEQFKMILANIHFLWELSKQPAALAQFRDFSDSVLILINVFVNYQGPFEQLRTLVQSLALMIAAEVADDETSVYFLAEESCLDFVVEILTRSVSAGDKYLNYHGVYAVDIAKCIENLSRFESLQEALLGKGVVELLVSMIQIGDPHDDAAAASALNKMMRSQETVNVPVLFEGLASYCEKDGSGNKMEFMARNDDQRMPSAKEMEIVESLAKGQVGGLTGLDMSEISADNKEEFITKGQQQSVEGSHEVSTEKISNIISDNYGNGSVVVKKTITTEIDPNTKTIIASREENAEATSLENSNNNCYITEGQEKNREAEIAGVSLKDDIKEDIGTATEMKLGHEPNYKEDACHQGTQILCCQGDDRETTKQPEQNCSTKAPSIGSETPCTEDVIQLHKAEPYYYRQEISAYVKKQLENIGQEEIKYIKMPVQLEPDVTKQPASEDKQCPVSGPFQYQTDGTDPVSGQDLYQIHLSLIDLGVHNMYDEKLVSLLNKILEETKLQEDGVFDILNHVPDVYSYKMLRTGSMQRQLRVVPAYNDGDLSVPCIHVQPEIDYHLVLKKFVFQVVKDHGSEMDFPGFTLIGPWCDTIPAELEEWSFCFTSNKATEGKMHYYLSAGRMKTNFLFPILLSFMQMNIQCKALIAKGESLERENLKHHGITVRKIEENGPAVTVYYFNKYLTVDYVLSLRHIQWPSCAASWPHRQRLWPDIDTVKDITNYGCHLVPKQPACLSESDPLYGMFFQYSFARAENVLLNKLNDDNPVLTDCLRMLKFVCELHFDRPKLLKSYHMQTLVLLAAERLPPSHWKANNFVKHLLDLLDDLLHFLVAHNLPNYFIPQQNLFEQFAPDFILDVAVRVSKVRRDPMKYLTPSHDPARFGIYLI